MKKIFLIATLFSLQTFADRIPATSADPNDMLERHENAAETGGLILHEGTGCVGCIAMKKSGKAKHTWSTETNFTPGSGTAATSSGSATGER